MTEPVFLDANCFKNYVDCQVQGGTGLPTNCIDYLKQSYHFALDDGDLFLQEWKDCTGGFASELVQTIIGDMFIADVIRTYTKVSNTANRRRFSALGVPNKDVRIICFVLQINARGIVTNDIDFYDPSANGQGQARRLAIIQARQGPVCRALERHDNVIVVSLSEAPNHL